MTFPKTSNDLREKRKEGMHYMTIATKLSRLALLGTLTVVGASTPLALNANAAHAASVNSNTEANQSQSAGILTKTSDSTLLLTPSPGASVDIDEKTITQNGRTEALPDSATDQRGETVKLDYVKKDGGIEIRAISSSASMERSVGKCLTGIGGGAVTGGTTGGLGGAAVGTVTLPVIGTVGGGTVGAIGGAVGGGLTGASVACFD